MAGHHVFSRAQQGKADGALMRILQHYQRLQCFLKALDLSQANRYRTSIRNNQKSLNPDSKSGKNDNGGPATKKV